MKQSNDGNGKGKKIVDSIIYAPYILTMAENDKDLHTNYGVVINDDKIVDIDKRSNIVKNYKATNVYKFSDHLLMPGFINTHGHIPMSIYGGKLPGELDFHDIIFNYMLPIEQEFCSKPDAVYLGALLGLNELIKYGVTTTTEMYYHSESIAKAFAESGIRGIIGETVLSQVPSPSNRTADEAVEYAEKYINNWKDHTLVTPAIAPHAPYSVSDKYLKQSVELARKYDVPMLMHANETLDEVSMNSDIGLGNFYYKRSKKNLEPIEYLEKIGFLSHSKITFAHCVYLTDKEIDLFAKYNIGVAYCGVCNCTIGNDVARIIELLGKNVPVGLGTDGPLTNDRIDIISQFRPLLSMLRSKYKTSTAISEYELVKMSTMGAARAIHMEKEIGSIEVGKKADLISIRIPPLERDMLYFDNNNPYTYLARICLPSQVEWTMVNGKIPNRTFNPALNNKLSPLLEKIKKWQPSDKA